MKNYRFLGEEAEILGQRLDAARKMSAQSTTPWAKTYWQNVAQRLLFQWRQLPILHDSDAQVTIIPKWTVSYDFYEHQQEGNLYGMTDRMFDTLFRKNADLDASWHAHREARLAKAQ
jgi:hypothetical protein